MNIEPIAYFRSPFVSKFGIPRQSGLVEELRGDIHLVADWRVADALRGLEDYDYLWLIWEFSGNRAARKTPTVRPPRLGGNERVGVFATRSPFRPNNLGLSAVRLLGVDWHADDGPVVHVGGADLMDGTPIYDIKPYLPFTDSHPGARAGMVDTRPWAKLVVELPEGMEEMFDRTQLQALVRTLEQDPRPHYQDDPARIYGLVFCGRNVRFRVDGNRLVVLV